MKRIYNDIPLQSILYLVHGTTKIIVEDYTRSALFSPWERNIGPVDRWEGKAYDQHKIPYKFLRAKAQGIELSPIDPETIIFKVSTEFEQY